jgi:hypothetical protein
MIKFKLTELAAKMKDYPSPRDQFIQKQKESKNPPHPENKEELAFSRVLNRDITVTRVGENPEVVYVDDIPFSASETEILKSLKGSVTAEGLEAILLLKEVFEGRVIH